MSERKQQLSEGQLPPIVSPVYSCANPLTDQITQGEIKFHAQYFVTAADDDGNWTGSDSESGSWVWESDGTFTDPTYADAFEAFRQFLVETNDFHVYFEGVDVIQNADGVWQIWLVTGS